MMNSDRLKHLRVLLNKKKIDALLLSDPFSVQFFSGFSSSNAFLIITAKKVLFLTDARYLEGAKESFSGAGGHDPLLGDVTILEFPKEPKEWESFFKKRKIESIGTEFTKLTVTRHKIWKKYFKVKIGDISKEISVIRSRKSDEEIEATQRAAQVADKALGIALKKIKVGMTEKDLAWEIEKSARELGAEKLSFDTIVAFGSNSAVPHHSPTEKKLTKNTPILIDWGVIANGFCSDCTRCFFYGKPTKEWQEVYAKVLAGQEAGMKKMLPGKKLSESQKAAEEVMEEKIPHGFGHGVGVEVHEYPGVSTKSKGTFEENMLITAEPGMYFSGRFGIRIEDLVVVRKEEIEYLTRYTKEIEEVIIDS